LPDMVAMHTHTVATKKKRFLKANADFRQAPRSTVATANLAGNGCKNR
jgi:hypothetical protein